MEEDDRLWLLIARKLCGEASEKDLKELQELLIQNPDATYYIEILSAWWKGKNEDKCKIKFCRGRD